MSSLPPGPEGRSPHKSIVSWLGMLGLALCPLTGYAGDLLDGEVETLATIEVPGTVVIQEPRRFPRLPLEVTSLQPLPNQYIVQQETRKQLPPSPNRLNFRDSIAETRGGRKSVSPIKAERPPYPRLAREQRWEGTVVLRLEVQTNGSIGAIALKRTSGHEVLDESAKRAVQQWQFAPAMDGEFPIRSIIDLPIKFDLSQ